MKINEHNVNYKKIDRYIGLFIAIITIAYFAIAANGYYWDGDINLLCIKLQIIAAIAVIMLLSFT